MSASMAPCQEQVRSPPQQDETRKDLQLIYAQLCYEGRQMKWPYVWVIAL